MMTLLNRTIALAALCAALMSVSAIASADGDNGRRDDHGVSKKSNLVSWLDRLSGIHDRSDRQSDRNWNKDCNPIPDRGWDRRGQDNRGQDNRGKNSHGNDSRGNNSRRDNRGNGDRGGYNRGR